MLHAGHDRRDSDAEGQVDDGARGERLDRPRRVGLSSATLIVSATDEFLSRFSDSLVAGGTMSRSAIGTMTSRYA